MPRTRARKKQAPKPDTALLRALIEEAADVLERLTAQLHLLPHLDPENLAPDGMVVTFDPEGPTLAITGPAAKGCQPTRSGKPLLAEILLGVRPDPPPRSATAKDPFAWLNAFTEATRARDAAMQGSQAKPTPEIVREWFSKLSLRFHPDRGGSTEAMAAINAARDLLLEQMGK